MKGRIMATRWRRRQIRGRLVKVLAADMPAEYHGKAAGMPQAEPEGSQQPAADDGEKDGEEEGPEEDG